MKLLKGRPLGAKPGKPVRTAPRAGRRAAARRPPGGQRGLSLISLIFVGMIVVLLLIVGFKIVPAITEYLAIDHAVQRIGNEGTTVRDIRGAFDRYATIDDIKSLSSKDLDITKDGDRVIVTYSYSYPVPILDNVRLVIDFSGSNRDRPNRGGPP